MWDPDREAMDPAARRRLQLLRLQKLLTRLNHQSPFYRGRFEAARFHAEGAGTLDDLQTLPFTTKADLRSQFPFGMLDGTDEPLELHCSSGTTGASVIAGYTRNDLETWTEVMARTLTAAGVRAGDLVHNAYGYGLFTGGLGFHYGASGPGCCRSRPATPPGRCDCCASCAPPCWPAPPRTPCTLRR